MGDSKFSYKSVTDTDLELFNKHKKSIDSEVRKKHSSIPANFELEPVRVRHLEACGTIHEYKIAVPENQFVKISFLTDGIETLAPGQQRSDQPTEPEINVDDKLTSTADE